MTEVDLRLIQGCFGLFDLGLGRLIFLTGLVVLRLGDDLLFCQLRVAIEVASGFGVSGSCSGECGRELIDLSLIGIGLDGGEQFLRLDRVAALDVAQVTVGTPHLFDRFDIAANLGGN